MTTLILRRTHSALSGVVPGKLCRIKPPGYANVDDQRQLRAIAASRISVPASRHRPRQIFKVQFLFLKLQPFNIAFK